jgi:hypothetical protein
MQADDSADIVQAIDQNGGVFAASVYPLGSNPGKKLITITGNASTMVRGSVNMCDSDSQTVCALADVELISDPISITKEVYAVEVKPAKADYIVPVTAEGYATSDTMIEYDILPAEYLAGNAVVRISKRPSNPDLSPEHIRYLDAERQGHGFVTLARGFRFDPDAEYFATVILNNGSNATRIMSREISLKPISLDLDGDLNKDGLFTEDDPQETMGMGLVVPVNIDDDDGDGVMDYDDNELIDDSGNRVTDDDLVEVKLHAAPAGLSEGTIKLEIENINSGQVKIWLSRDKDNLLLDPSITPIKEWPLSSAANLTGLPSSIFIEGITGSGAGGDVIVKTGYISPAGMEIEVDRISVTVLQVDMVPDYDRNGVIDDNDRNKVTSSRLWRFWINDDNDNGSDSSGIGGNDRPGLGNDLMDFPNNDFELTPVPQVNGIRDLIDFFPLYLDIKSLVDLYDPASGYIYLLKNADKAVSFVEGIAGDIVLTTGGAKDYLEDVSLATPIAFKDLPIKKATPEGVELSRGFLDRIRESSSNGILLIEGRKTSSAPLVLEVIKNGKVLLTHWFPLEIVGVEEMFGHKNLRGVAGATDGDPDRFVEIDPQTQKLMVGDNFKIGEQPYCMQGVDKSLVWMHGYNVDPEAARATIAEVFKRFFHAGLNGRFYGVSWYGDPPGGTTPDLAPHYHQSVVNAFATAGAYKDFINSIPGTTSIAAHSLGNMVAGSAIQDENLTEFANYFAIDAAVALEAYGQITATSSMMEFSNTDGDNWQEYYADPVARKVLASEWYDLFPADDPNNSNDQEDARRGLTWRKRLDKVAPTGKVYNFYSSTEDVLREYTGDNLLFDGTFWDFGDFTWVKQEKFKGRSMFMNVGGVSSPFCGWGYNPNYYITVDDGNGSTYDRRYTVEEAAAFANGLDHENNPVDLKTNLLFNLRSELEFLLQDDDGASINRKVSQEPALTSYYENNRKAHELVTVRDWLLAEAFPSTTLPMGANENTKLLTNNFDMSEDSSKGGCCKTSEASWPLDRKGEWKHSDYKEISYQHTYEFYKKINGLIN